MRADNDSSDYEIFSITNKLVWLFIDFEIQVNLLFTDLSYSQDLTVEDLF